MRTLCRHFLYLIIQSFILLKIWFIYSYWWGQMLLAILSATTFLGTILIIGEWIEYIKSFK